MALRKGRCYKKVTKAYTRKSKFKKKGYIKAVPNIRITRFDMGDLTKKFQYQANLISKQNLQIRHNALESARIVVNRHLHKHLGLNYHLKIMVYPHQVLRENKMLVGAGADRMQTGMQKAFGKAIGTAAQLKKGQTIFSIKVDKQHLQVAKDALKKAAPRLPTKCAVEIKELE